MWYIVYINERFIDIALKLHVWHYNNERFVDITLKWPSEIAKNRQNPVFCRFKALGAQK